MLTDDHFRVFEKYAKSGAHAFSSGVVTDEDKDFYQDIFSALDDAVRQAISADQYLDFFEPWSVRFARSGGVQGHRPIDLWASAINKAPNSFGRFPQIYAIASSAGIEIGFSVAIHEDDYHNLTIKLRNREIIQTLYRRLPDPDDEFVAQLDAELEADGRWMFGRKTRQGSSGTFASFSELVRFLQSPEGPARGGGAIFRVISLEMATDAGFDLAKEVADTVAQFAPLMRRLTPSDADLSRLSDRELMLQFSEEFQPFEASDLHDGREKILRSVVQRQGQQKFRDKLLDAYEGRCAMTGTEVLETLQAAHIVPYNGESTNAVQNGLLLRADVHVLFDLGLILVDPETRSIIVSPDIKPGSYDHLHGRVLAEPKRKSQRPTDETLVFRMDMFKGPST